MYEEENNHYTNYLYINNNKIGLSESESDLNSLNKDKINFSFSKTNLYNKKENGSNKNSKTNKYSSKLTNNATNDLFENKSNLCNLNDISSCEGNNIGDVLLINDENCEEQNINSNKKIEENKNTIILVNEIPIKAINKTLINVITELTGNHEINYSTKLDMQLLRKKNPRRTKKEIERDNLHKPDEKILKKKKGRNKKDGTISNKEDDTHSKLADDNILKKISSGFLQSVYSWLNESFINEKGEFCITQKKFLKIEQIFSNLTKKEVTKLMKANFKDIFSKDISNKYKNFDKAFNKNLIKEIYEEKKQYFVIFILDLNFIEVLSIFDLEISTNEFKDSLLKKISLEDTIIEDNIINEFYRKFNKIDWFLKKVYSEEIKKSPKNNVVEYIERIGLLSVNYEVWFKRKFHRKSNKIINCYKENIK